MTARDLAAAGCTLTMPSRHIKDPKFKYVPAAATDVRRTWRKARLMLRLAKGAA